VKEPTPWRRVLIEGAVIVVSILLALWADAWWARRQARGEEQAALQGLAEDFSANVAQLGSVIRTHEVARTLVTRLQAMSVAAIRALPPDSIARYAGAIRTPRSFNPQDGTLDALIASGGLGLISDSNLRDMLVAWKGRASDADEESRMLQEVAERVMQRMVQLGGPWRLAPVVEAPALAGLAEATATYPAADLARASRDATLMELTRWKQFAATLYLLELRPLALHADSILRLVARNRR
jgi:hypothetical protein